MKADHMSSHCRMGHWIHQASTNPSNADMSPMNKNYESLSGISANRSRIVNSIWKNQLEMTTLNHFDSMSITYSMQNNSAHQNYISNQ